MEKHFSTCLPLEWFSRRDLKGGGFALQMSSNDLEGFS